MVQKVIKENPQAVADYKAGKQNAIGYLTGQVVRASQDRANPQEIYKLLQSEL